MAKSTHDKQLERARQKRQQDVLAKRRGRSRVLVFVLVGLMVLALIGAALVSVIDPGGSPIVDDEPGATEDQGPDDQEAEDLAADQRPEGACPPTPDDAPEPTSTLYDEAPDTVIEEGVAYTATVATTCGDIVLELDAENAPETVNNFVFLAEDGYYDGVIFHRVVEGFVIQGGDPAGTGCGREDCSPAGDGPAFPGYTIDDELDAAVQLVSEEGGYPQGALAMANAGPDTNGSQFFIVEPDDGVPLPPAYTLFGRVLEGLDVVQSIALGPAAGDVAVDPVVITSVTIETS